MSFSTIWKEGIVAGKHGARLVIRHNTVRRMKSTLFDQNNVVYLGLLLLGGTARIEDNVFEARVSKLMYGTGIEVNDGRAVVQRNRVDGFSGPGIYFAEQPGGVVARNHVVRTDTGIDIEGLFGEPIMHVEVDHNRVHGSVRGIWVLDAVELDIHDNDFRGNRGIDCRDFTTGSGTGGTANTWVNNLGDESRPEGICSPG
jgi:nitrous oxidase accessory protein NosD